MHASNRGACRRSNDGGPSMHEGLHMDATVQPIHRLRDDIGRTVGVSMALHTAAGALKHPPPWCGMAHVSAVATGARGVGFIDLADGDALPPGFVDDVPHKLAVRPLADLLVGSRAFVDPIRDVTHVPNRQVLDALCDGKVDQLPASLVQM